MVRDRTRVTDQGMRSIQENYQQELEALLSVDDAVGRMLATLRETGELDNTLFIYTSDNGFFHGEHRIRSEKVLPYEAGIRVPLLMRGPGVPAGARPRQLVANVDLAPTILEAAGATPRRLQDGRSLLGLLRDQGTEFGREILLENGNGANQIPPYTGIRNDRFLFVRHKATGEQELYDLRVDPFELQNLDEDEAYDRPRRLLQKRLRVLEDCAGSACLATQPAVKLRLREVLPLASRRKRVPRPLVRPVRSCLRGGLRAALYGAERKLVQHVRYFSGRTVLGATRKAPFRIDVKRANLPPKGSAAVIRARVTTLDGRIITRDRVVQTCPEL
ncbi:MAG: sulfatase-like hydrolase/transferase [Thermoleophilaceae bacterium]|nr:sulfatase-like hydrolase/transferase [Thermoleophilaceae bacterium]